MASKTKGFTIRFKYNAPVVLTFAVVSFIAFLWTTMMKGTSFNPDKWFFTTYRCSPLDPLAYVRAVGHVLGHANWEHFYNNMLFFLLLGPILEEKYGSKPILFMIVITAVITAIVNALFMQHTLSGSSGIVFMFIVLSSVVAVEKGEIPISFIIIVALWLGKEFYQVGSYDRVSHIAHIIGGVAGSFFGFANLGTKKK